MVATAVAAKAASGAGGASMKIKGSLDTANIESGFSRVKSGFSNVKGQANSFTADLTRMTTAAGGLVKKMSVLAITGAGAMVAIASKAPAVAPALARMQVAFGKLTRNLGEALAPAFERVAGWLDRLATWVGENKGTISEIAGTILDWAEKVGEWLYPALKKVGDWASEHPKFFAALFAGLAFGPAILGGISAATGLVTTIAGATVGTGVLTALGYIAAIGGASYLGYKGATWTVDKLQTYTGMGTDPNAPTDMSGQTLLSRLPQKIWADIRGVDAPWDDPTNPNSPAHFAMLEQIKADAASGKRIGGSNAMISAAPEQDRRFFLLGWWDAVWG